MYTLYSLRIFLFFEIFLFLSADENSNIQVISTLYKFYYYYYTININVDGIQVTQTTHGKSLGLNIDDNLFWKALIYDTSKIVSSSIGELASQVICFLVHYS